MKKEHHIVRTIVGFLLTIFALIFAYSASAVFICNDSLLKGGSTKKILKNDGVYKFISDIIVEETCENAKDLGISEKGVKSIINEKNIQNITENIIDAATEDSVYSEEEAGEDFESLVNSYTEASTDAILDYVYKDTDQASINDMINCSLLTDIDEDFDIDISGTIKSELSEEYGDNYLDVELTRNQAEELINSELSDGVKQATESISDEFSENCANVSSDLNKDENSQNEFGKYIDYIDETIKLAELGLVILVILLICNFGLQLLLYRKSIYRTFRNFSVIGIINIIFCAAIILGLKYGKVVLKEETEKQLDIGKNAMETFSENLIDKISISTEKVLIATVIVTVICIILNIALKNRERKNAES